MVVSPSGPDKLRTCLGSIREAGLTAADRKAAIRRAVELYMLGVDALDGGQQTQARAVDELDSVLASLKSAAKLTGNVTIEDAKRWLRSHGPRGIAAASQLGKLSKRRNGDCHPLARQLIAEVSLIARTAGSEDEAGDCGDILSTSASGVEHFDIASSVGEPSPPDVEGESEANLVKVPPSFAASGPPKEAVRSLDLQAHDEMADSFLQTISVQEKWQHFAGAGLALGRLSYLRELIAAPASGRAMVTRARGRSNSCSSCGSKYSEKAGENNVVLLKNGRGQSASAAESQVAEAESSEEGEQMDPVLETYVDAIIMAVCDTPVADAKAVLKHHCAVFIRARVARGDSRSEAKDEAFSLLRYATESKKAGLSPI